MTTHTPPDSTLRWSMRLIGLLLAAVCVFLITRDVDHSAEALWFLSLGTGLGVITLVSSWMPTRTPETKPVRA